MMTLAVDRLHEAARAQFDLQSFGDRIYEPALDALLRAINEEAQIDGMRRFRTVMQLVTLLGMRARIDAAWRAYPEALALPIEAPIFVVGLPRTGTTLLQNLLAGHPELRAPKLHEMRAPVPPEPGEYAWSEADAIADSTNLLEMLYQIVPEFRAIHPMNARAPDECSWLFRHNFATMVYAFTYHVPSYVEWLTSTDMEPYYRYYRRLLQLLQWQRPGRRWILKDPCHLWHLDALFRVFPDARVVMMHRELDEALPSLASLCHALHRVESERSDPQAMAGYCMDMADRGLHAMMRLRPVLLGSRVLDVRYRELIGDTEGTLQKICAFAELSGEEPELERMMQWVLDNQQHGAGRHRYSLEQYGFEARKLRACFAAYEDRFLPRA